MKPAWKSNCGNVVLYYGDCKKLLPMECDAVVADPPYGINYLSPKPGAVFSKESDRVKGDEKEFNPTPFLYPKKVLLFGGNNFCKSLPYGGWIVWDKRLSERADRIFGSPFELAWTSNPKLYKMIRVGHGAYLNADNPGQRRFHPTQKPIKVMLKCLEYLKIAPGETVFDPFMGSGSTGLACILKGIRFVGCEIKKEYFEIAKKRIQRELSGFINYYDSSK